MVPPLRSRPPIPIHRLIAHPEEGFFCTTQKCVKAAICLMGVGCCTLGNTLLAANISQCCNGVGCLLNSMSGLTFFGIGRGPDFQDAREVQSYKQMCLHTSFHSLYESGIQIRGFRFTFDQIIGLGLLNRSEWREKYCRMLHVVPQEKFVGHDRLFELGLLDLEEYQNLNLFLADPHPSEESKKELLAQLSESMLPQDAEGME